VSLLRAASSKSKGLLVAPITRILVLDDPTPSSYTKNSVLSLLEDSFSPSLDLFPKMESTSSKNMILGDYIAARAKRVLISFSLSPIHFDTNELALILKKVDLHSVATAFASIVFPLPGGPYSRIPLVGALSPTNISGLN
jgi:hypothetical protein